MFGIAILVVLVASFFVGLLTLFLNRLTFRFLSDKKARLYVLIGFFVISTSLVSSYLTQSIYYVGSDEVGVVEKKFSLGFANSLPPTRYVARDGEIGVQADLLAPGVHFVPAIFSFAESHPLTEIDQAKIGIVEALDGRPLPVGTEVSPHQWTEEGWYEPGKFLTSENSYRGIQVPPLRPGKHRLHPHLFRVIPVDTTLQIVRFGRGEPERGGTRVPGRMGELYVSANGTPLIANFRVNYRVTPDSAYKAISQLGTDFHDRLLELVQSTARTTVRSTIEPLDLFELKDDREKYENMIFSAMEKQLEPYGVQLVLADFTSIFPPQDREGDSFRSLEKKRSELAQEVEEAKVSLLREENRVSLAKAKLAAVEAEATGAKRKAEIEKEQAQTNLESAKLTAESEVENVRLLAEYLGPSGAAFYLAVRDASENGVDILPDVVVPGEGSELPAFFTERYFRKEIDNEPLENKPVNK